MKTRVLLSLALIFSAFCMNVKAVDPVQDPYSYPARNDGKYTLTGKWLYSLSTENYLELAVTPTNVRQMAYKDGKLLFGSRDGGLKILVVDAATGALETPVTLGAEVFAGNLDYACNDIRVDAAGHVLVGCIKLANGKFQIWNVDLATGNGTLVLEEDATSLVKADRFDTFTVLGDVTRNATIFAVGSTSTAGSVNMYRWKITDGTAATPELILIDFLAGGFPANVTAVGSSPCAFPVTEDLVYLDGTTTFPTLMQISGDEEEGYTAIAVDAFYDITDPSIPVPNLVDEITEPGKQFGMQASLNGFAQFTVGGDHFMVFGIRAHGALTGYEDTPKQSFRLFKYKDSDLKLREAEILWTFPQAGLGTSSANSAYLAPVAVNVEGSKASIYVYSLANGFGAYEFDTDASTGITSPVASTLSVYAGDKAVKFSEDVASAQIYSVTGQLVATATKTTSVAVATPGVYVVKAVAGNGVTSVQKVIVK
jgi:hypothetical protein